MTSRALDPLTLMRCIRELELSILGVNAEWNLTGEEQNTLFAWYLANKDILVRFTDLLATGSNDYKVINEWFTKNGFSIQIDPFSPTTGFAVASIIHKVVKWANGRAKTTTVRTWAQPDAIFEAFELPSEGVEVFEINLGGFMNTETLVRVITDGDADLWLLKTKEGDHAGTQMVELAISRMATRGASYTGEIESVTIPTVDFNVQPDVSFMEGASSGNYIVVQAVQEFSFHMDAEGAEVKVVSGGLVKASRGPLKVTFDSPFYGWWIQRGLEEIPFAVFYADVDSWKKIPQKPRPTGLVFA